MASKDEQPPGWNADTRDTLLWWCDLSAEQAEQDVIEKGIAKRTAKNLFALTSEPNDNTLTKVAEYFSLKSDGLLHLKASDLRKPPPTLRRLVDRYKEATRPRPEPAPAAPALTPAPAGRCTVHESQDAAIHALKTRVENGMSLNGRTVYVVSFTLHTLLPAVRWFCDQKAASVRLFAGEEETARKANSKRQEGLMTEQQKHLDQDFAHDPIPPVLRSEMPPTFHGYFVPGVVVCVSPFVWYPTFKNWKGSTEWEEMRKEMRAAGVAPPDLPQDDYTLNGYQQCHFQVFHEAGGDNRQFDHLAKKFKLYLDSHELHQRLLEADKAKPAG